MQIGQVIHEYRKRSGLTQEQMAERLGVTTPAVNKWENGVSNPDIELLAPIARLLGISTDTLLSYRKDLTAAEIEDIICELDDRLNSMPYDQVFAWAEEIAGRYPNCGRLIWQMALILDVRRITDQVTEAGQYDDKILKWYETVLAEDGKELRAKAADSLFQFWMRKERYEEAEKYLVHFAESDRVGQINRARLSQAKGDTEEAFRIYERLLFDSWQTCNMTISMMSALAVRAQDADAAQYYRNKHEEFAHAYEVGRYTEISGMLELTCAEKDVEETLRVARELLQNIDTVDDFQRSGLYRHLEFQAIDGKTYGKLKATLLNAFRNEESLAFMRGNAEWEAMLAEKV